MTLDQLADMIHRRTGATGKQLEAMCFYYAIKLAALTGDEDQIAYFQQRLVETVETWPEYEQERENA